MRKYEALRRAEEVKPDPYKVEPAVTDKGGSDWAIFNDEGMIEGGMDYEEAVAALTNDYSEDDANISRECRDHAGMDAVHCEECNCEEEGED
jgi:hypothetical protein